MMMLLTSLWLGASALAQDPVDIGVVKNSDVRVVQKLLYPKFNRTEMGIHVGIMPFDAYLLTPNVQLSYLSHRSERLAFGGVAGGGFGLKSATYREMESPTYGVAPAAYRYLGSVLGGAQYSPVYGKMNLDGRKVLHYDLYGAAMAGATVESSVIPGGGLAFAPTVSLGVGTRLFLDDRHALRVELRDDLLVEHRALTDSTHFKQNANVSIGYTVFSPMPVRP